MRTAGLGLAALAMLSYGGTPASAATLLGQAVSVVPSVSGHQDSGDVTILTGNDLFEGETISTKASGQVQIVFTDNTHMVIGPSSEVVIERYLMRNDNTVADFAVKAIGGTFRFITGDSPKGAYKISTPTGTIGVRGTEFDFWVKQASGETGLLLFGGAVNMCGLTGHCVWVQDRCSMAVMGDTETNLLDDQQRTKPLRSNLPYVLSQSRLRRDFHVVAPSACAQKGPPAATAESTPAPLLVIAVPVVPPPPPPDEEDPPPSHGDGDHNNNGFGNGAESGDGAGGTTEPNNPGNHYGNSHANPHGHGQGGD